MEVVESRRPERIVERTIGAGGRRRTRGTYTLTDAPGGGTHVQFELAFERIPLWERPLMLLLRPWLERGNRKAMGRLRETLTSRAG